MAFTTAIPQTRPISDLRTHLNDIEEEARTTGEPIVLTRNGSASLVVMSSAAYNESVARQRHVSKLREAEIEAKYRADSLTLAQSRAHMEELAALVESAND